MWNCLYPAAEKYIGCRARPDLRKRNRGTGAEHLLPRLNERQSIARYRQADIGGKGKFTNIAFRCYIGSGTSDNSLLGLVTRQVVDYGRLAYLS